MNPETEVINTIITSLRRYPTDWQHRGYKEISHSKANTAIVVSNSGNIEINGTLVSGWFNKWRLRLYVKSFIKEETRRRAEVTRNTVLTAVNDKLKPYVTPADRFISNL